MKNGKCIICKIIGLVAAVGALNWGFIAFFKTDLVFKLFSSSPQAQQIVYGVIGVTGLIVLLSLFGIGCPCCKKDGSCK